MHSISHLIYFRSLIVAHRFHFFLYLYLFTEFSSAKRWHKESTSVSLPFFVQKTKKKINTVETSYAHNSYGSVLYFFFCDKVNTLQPILLLLFLLSRLDFVSFFLLVLSCEMWTITFTCVQCSRKCRICTYIYIFSSMWCVRSGRKKISA